jgi:hypothetical protein
MIIVWLLRHLPCPTFTTLAHTADPSQQHFLLTSRARKCTTAPAIAYSCFLPIVHKNSADRTHIVENDECETITMRRGNVSMWIMKYYGKVSGSKATSVNFFIIAFSIYSVPCCMLQFNSSRLCTFESPTVRQDHISRLANFLINFARAFKAAAMTARWFQKKIRLRLPVQYHNPLRLSAGRVVAVPISSCRS